MSNSKDNSYINSLVGKGTRFDGELNLSGLLRIDGDFTGSINTDGKVLIGKSGRVKCSINAGSVVIGGVVKGNIYSTGKVVVLSTGMVLGNIEAPGIIIEEGVIFNGKCRVLSGEASTYEHRKGAAVSEYKPDWGTSEEKKEDKAKAEFLSWKK
ncbi:bactofilin family protein [Spirochaeta isovalerica]|uniref:Cytoskeletal protein CcmA (Bactofilin family) n=1 Tax=Spirochaeta isovalerica TaxID=150 RepID=A0A841RAV6_9SPIO|nr:polymer-forming cytoskeletal protein [Spirochaeta isovalerica]MBB6480846.1 cytoskeletal protein CcmA (bactofilin family) [Spirochaeta isovalerica]